MKLTDYLNTRKLAQLGVLALILTPICSIGHAFNFEHFEDSARRRNVTNSSLNQGSSAPAAEPTAVVLTEETTTATSTRDGIPMMTTPFMDELKTPNKPAQTPQSFSRDALAQGLSDSIHKNRIANRAALITRATTRVTRINQINTNGSGQLGGNNTNVLVPVFAGAKTPSN